MSGRRVDDDAVWRDARGIRAPVACGSSGTGHHAHWIQWDKARRDPGTQVPATVLAVEVDAIRLAIDGEVVRQWHHDLERVRELVALTGPEIVAQLRWSLLWFDSYLISVRRADRRTPCTFETSAGGGVVPARATKESTVDELRRAVREQ